MSSSPTSSSSSSSSTPLTNLSSPTATTPPDSSPSPKTKPAHQFKVVLIGDAGVGKTSLRHRYLNQSFTISYRATIGVDFISKTIALPSSSANSNTTRISLSIWDTAGQERFRALSSSFFRGADACILCYSDRRSLLSLKHWFETFLEKSQVGDRNKAEFCWVGVRCKSDLEVAASDSFDEGEEQRLFNDLMRRDDHDDQDEDGGRDRDSIQGYSMGDVASVPIQSPIKSKKKRKELAGCCPDMPTQLEINSPPRRHHGTTWTSNHCDAEERRLPTSTSFNTFKTMNTIYHTPSSSFHDSFTSLTSDTDTIKPPNGEPVRRTRSSSSTSSSSFSLSGINQIPTIEEAISSELERERARGIDLFMASSPPAAPPSLITMGKHFGGPSIFQRDEKERLKQAQRKRVEASMSRIPGGAEGEANQPTQDDEFDKHRIELFKTSARTGDGVDQVFEYIAKRATWQWHQDEKRRKALQEQFNEPIRLGPEKTDNSPCFVRCVS